MAHTNETTNYGLPQFLGTDKPSWLGDINTAFSDIDTQMKVNSDAAAAAATDAETAAGGVATLNTRMTTAENNITTINSSITDLQSDMNDVEAVVDQAEYFSSATGKSDNYTFAGAAGYQTNSRRDVHLYINLPKEYKNASALPTIVLSQLNIIISGVGGNLDGSSAVNYLSDADALITTSWSGPNQIHIRIYKADEFPGPSSNNAPVFAHGTITVSVE